MNKRRVISVAVCLVVAALVLVVKYHPRTVPIEECSQIYRDYADNPHIAVAFIKDFPVNDSISVDVTTFQATDSVGWETLKKDFRALQLPESTQKKIAQGINIVTIHLAPQTDPTLPMDTTDILKNNVIAISRLNHTVSIFHTKTVAEQKAVKRNQHEKGFKIK